MTRTTYYPLPPKLPMTALNLETNERYLACLEAKGHRRGSEWTKPRPMGGEWKELPICDGCGVPVTGKIVSWNLTS